MGLGERVGQHVEEEPPKKIKIKKILTTVLCFPAVQCAQGKEGEGGRGDDVHFVNGGDERRDHCHYRHHHYYHHHYHHHYILPAPVLPTTHVPQISVYS